MSTVSLKVDEEFGPADASRGRMWENMKLSALRREQAGLRRVTGNFDASETADYVVHVAEERSRIIGCVYMRAMTASAMDAMIAGPTGAPAREPRGLGGLFSALGGARDRRRRRKDEGERPEGRVGYISNLITMESERRRGVAAELMRSIRAAAVRGGLSRLFCHVNADNDAARALYSNCAFVELGEDPDAVDSAAAAAAIPGRGRQRVLVLVSELAE